MMTKEKIEHSVREAIRAAQTLATPESLQFIEEAAKMIAQAFRSGRKVIIAGNGGSLCDAQHFAEELTGFFRKFRPALPAIALSEPGHLTCVSNDWGFEWVFARGVEAYGKKGDIFVGLTTSGNSENIVKAVDTAEAKGLRTITFLGKSGGTLKGRADLELLIQGFETSDRIQEAHMAAIHIIIEIVESLLADEEPEICEEPAESAVSSHK